MKEIRKIIREIVEQLVSEKYVTGKKLNDNVLDIEGSKIKFDIYPTKEGGDIYLLVDFYKTTEGGTKDYSEFDGGDSRQMLNRIQTILSSAYDAGLTYLIDKHNAFVGMGKQMPITGIAFYPKRSQTDATKLNSSKEAQRTSLYKRFMEQMLGRGAFDISESGGNIYMKFKDIKVDLGSPEFKEEFSKLPHAEEVLSAYGKKIQ